MTSQQIRMGALALDPFGREALAEELLLSIGESDREAIDTFWLPEVYRRDEASHAGAAKVKPTDDPIARLKKRSSEL